MILPKGAYAVLGIPQYYYGLAYKDTKLVMTKQKSIADSIAKAPTTGILLVSGTAAPVVNQMFELDRKVIGISFSELFDSRFNSGDNESYPKSSVVLIYSIGLEAAKDKSFSSTILNSLLSYYKARDTLVILETPLTLSNFQTTYSITIKNTLTIGLLEEESWL